MAVPEACRCSMIITLFCRNNSYFKFAHLWLGMFPVFFIRCLMCAHHIAWRIKRSCFIRIYVSVRILLNKVFMRYTRSDGSEDIFKGHDFMLVRWKVSLLRQIRPRILDTLKLFISRRDWVQNVVFEMSLSLITESYRRYFFFKNKLTVWVE